MLSVSPQSTLEDFVHLIRHLEIFFSKKVSYTHNNEKKCNFSDSGFMAVDTGIRRVDFLVSITIFFEEFFPYYLEAGRVLVSLDCAFF